ncbi:MAG: hypothetical protein ACOZQL_20485 [Myxococcota bacterium]
MNELIAQLTSFRQALGNVTGVRLSLPRPRRPASADELATLATQRTLTPELRDFLTVTADNVTLEQGDEALFSTTAFLDAAGVVRELRQLEQVIEDLADVEPDLVAFLRRAVPLQDKSRGGWFLDPQDGAVWMVPFDGEASVRVAGSLTEALQHWLAAGCFDNGGADAETFRRYWALVGQHVPVTVAPSKNGWLRALAKYYGAQDFP